MKITKEQLRDIIREAAASESGSFIIMKSSRARPDGSATPLNAYSNPETARRAGVEPGLIYTSREAAEADAQKLGRVNPVGFTVVRLAEARGPDDYRLGAAIRHLKAAISILDEMGYDETETLIDVLVRLEDPTL